MEPVQIIQDTTYSANSLWFAVLCTLVFLGITIRLLSKKHVGQLTYNQKNMLAMVSFVFFLVSASFLGFRGLGMDAKGDILVFEDHLELPQGTFAWESIQGLDIRQESIPNRLGQMSAPTDIMIIQLKDGNQYKVSGQQYDLRQLQQVIRTNLKR